MMPTSNYEIILDFQQKINMIRCTKSSLPRKRQLNYLERY